MLHQGSRHVNVWMFPLDSCKINIWLWPTPVPALPRRMLRFGWSFPWCSWVRVGLCWTLLASQSGQKLASTPESKKREGEVAKRTPKRWLRVFPTWMSQMQRHVELPVHLKLLFFFNFRAYVCSFVVEKVILARNYSWMLVLSDLWHAYCRECNIR